MLDLPALQARMRHERIDAWLLYDFRGCNFVLPRLLPPGKRWTTRRAFLLIPATGEPVILAHAIDFTQFDNAGMKRDKYLAWPDLHKWLKDSLTGKGRVAMEYAPGCTLPAVSIVDAGTVELVRACGVEVVSSANLIQTAIARWSPEAVKLHTVASREVAEVKDSAFNFIRDRLASGKDVNEYEAQQHIMAEFKLRGLETADTPIVAVNGHSGDPHFEVSATNPAPIKKGDWVLIDLWARRPGDENIFSDITWVGYCGRDIPARHREVYQTVKAARDASLARAVEGWKNKEMLQGWQLDDAARNVIVNAGFAEFLRHRTGHSLSAGPLVHGMGVNLDNLETHDTREVIPGVGYTIEPGIYTPEFGVRLEINVYTDPNNGPVVTSCLQEDVILLA